MTVARAAEDFSNAELLTKLSKGIDDVTAGVVPVRSPGESDPYRILFFSEQIAEKVSAEGLDAEASETRGQLVGVIRAMAQLAPALRRDYREVAGAIQKAKVFDAPKDDKWATLAHNVTHPYAR